ncbi:site-specific integrase [Vibrio sp. 1636]|uniref:Site-specific integrase n=1 Tax=Vibrio alginolyticus TaxID=663 RepID=A0A7Y0R130_VIBAL|nr:MULTISPECIES: site-specific integrase [Vibrio]MDW2204305.1 site-specific integrase [Vibrio sp. 1636]NMR76240.1 site-specific integrase [Vibrio alginolyticus]
MTTKRLRITDKAIERHLANEIITRLSDERYRLELRFHKNRQSGSWWFIDKRKHNGRDGKARWERLGTWPQLPAKALTDLIPQKLAKLATGIDETFSDWTTFGECLRWYLVHVDSSRQISKGRRSAVKSVINKHLLPALDTLPLTGVKKHQIKTLLVWPLQERYQLRTVKGYFAILKAAFMQAAKEELLSHNPMSVIQFSDFIRTKAKPKEGKLHPPMVAPLFDTLQSTSWTERMLVLMQLGHGTRISETRLARWCHIDWEEQVWRLPASHTKTKEALFLPLTEQMIALLKAYQASQPDGTLVLFPDHDIKKPMGKDKANAIYQQVSDKAWTSHDCRKLARSRLADLGVDKFVGERLLNHKLSDLDQAYIHTTTETLKKEALETYHAWLDTQGFFIFHGKTVGRSKKQTQAIEAAGWL